jgi:hypothetical protein
MYKILPYTYNQAKKYNVIVKPSTRRNKKIDIYNKRGEYLTSAGNIGYFDYAYYLKYYGYQIANERRRLYKIRHQKDRTKKNTAGWFADKLLW